MEFMPESQEFLVPSLQELVMPTLESKEVLALEFIAPELELLALEFVVPELLDSESMVPNSLPSDSEMTMLDSWPPDAFICAR